MTLKFKRIDSKAQLPKYATSGSACFDLSIIVDNGKNYPRSLSAVEGALTHTVSYGYDKDGAVNTDKYMITIEPHCSVAFHTGLKCEIEPGKSMKIYDRSSTGIKSALLLSNGVGVIDSDYRGEIMIALTNLSNVPRVIYSGDRVAQAEIVPIIQEDIIEVDELSDTERGESGIGSSGR